MAEEKMSKKLRQAVQHANETNPSSRTRNHAHVSKVNKKRGKV